MSLTTANDNNQRDADRSCFPLRFEHLHMEDTRLENPYLSGEDLVIPFSNLVLIQVEDPHGITTRDPFIKDMLIPQGKECALVPSGELVFPKVVESIRLVRCTVHPAGVNTTEFSYELEPFTENDLEGVSVPKRLSLTHDMSERGHFVRGGRPYRIASWYIHSEAPEIRIRAPLSRATNS